MNNCILRWTIVLLSLLNLVQGDNVVGIKSKNDQILTSTTLHWANGYGDGRDLKNAVIGGFNIDPQAINSANPDDIKNNSIYICRMRHDGVFIPGQLRPNYKECKISAYKNVNHSPRYEVLKNVDDGALLSWVHWEKLDVPSGAVSGGINLYIARKPVSAENDGSKKLGYTHFVGRLDPENLGKILVIDDNDNEKVFESGEILVETEPIRYEITNLRFDMRKIRVKKIPVVLAETILKNEGDTDAINVDSALAYNSTYRLSWGHVNSVIKGMNTTVRVENGTIVDEVMWGIDNKEQRQDVKKVEIYLEPGTACNVTLRANDTDMDVPYNATLISFYPDGITRSRLIHGVKNEVGMMEVTPEYGPIYYLQNNSLVPTTTTTTTTTTSTTTTTTTTTEAPIQIDEIPDEPKILSEKEKELMATPKKGENQSMMSDEGDPSTLKKKDHIQQASVLGSSGAVLVPSFLLLLAALCSSVRQQL